MHKIVLMAHFIITMSASSFPLTASESNESTMRA